MKIQIRNEKSREEIQITFLIVRHKKGNEHADWFKISFDMFDGQLGEKIKLPFWLKVTVFMV